MKFLLNTIKFILSLTISVAILVSYFQSYYPPTKVGLLAFSGFGFPYLWAIGAIAFVLLLIVHSRVSSLTLFVSLIATFAGATSIVNFVPDKDEVSEGKKIKVMTFNIGYFCKSNNGKDIVIKQMKEFFADVDADIICLQEAPTGNMMKKDLDDMDYKAAFGYQYQAFDHYAEKREPYGTTAQVILSKYPIEIDKSISLSADQHLMPSVVDIDGQKIKLINCHMESIRLLPDQIEAVNKVQHADIRKRDKTKTELKKTYDKMKQAFINRQVQTDTLVNVIKSADMPVVVCGDFNDTPISYTYRQIKDLLEDTFSHSFMSIGDTFNGDLPKLRIDYIFHSKDIESEGYLVNKKNISDHYAVMSTIVIK